MAASFDPAAEHYDDEFTTTKLGKLYRQRVWKYLDKIILDYNISSVLELNCGTGEDAIYLHDKGCKVLATDLSENMLDIAKSKSSNKNIVYKKLDIANPQLDINQKFDLVFSNFGGLNCIDLEKLGVLNNWIDKVTHSNSHLIFVIMPSMTVIDRFYRVMKGEHDINRQRKNLKMLPVNVNGQIVQTYYHDPKVVISIFSSFTDVNSHSIGFVPSFLERNKLRDILIMLDKLLYKMNTGPLKSDHYLIHLTKANMQKI